VAVSASVFPNKMPIVIGSILLVRDARIELSKGLTCVVCTWPHAAAECVAWMHELLR
jgi:hypothetical protein